MVVGAEKRDKTKARGKTNLQYDACSIEELMAVDGMDDDYSNWQRSYRDDPAFGVGRRAEATPPLRRVLHIYGTNIDTEIGSVYRHRTCRRKAAHVESSVELDTSACLEVEKDRNQSNTRNKVRAHWSLTTVPRFSLPASVSSSSSLLHILLLLHHITSLRLACFP